MGYSLSTSFYLQIEIRTDAFKLISATNRPHYRGAEDIGTWFKILEALGVAAVITNCLLIGFSYDTISDFFDGEENQAFKTFAVIVILEVKGYLHSCNIHRRHVGY